jgi:hypothetical protein
LDVAVVTRVLMFWQREGASPVFARSRLGLFAVAICVACAGCERRPDRWAQYESGGSFSTGAPSMSPADGSIVFASPRSGHGDIYRWRPGGAPPERLTDDPAVEASPLFSPDGKRIAFLREEGSHSHVYLMDLAARTEVQLTFGAVMDEPQSFSADNNGLLIIRRTAESGNSRQCVAINLADLSEIIVGTSACFSADNKQNFFSEKKIFFSDIDPKSHLSFVWSVDRRGERRAAVCDGQLQGILPDGRSLLVTLAKGTDWQLYDLPTRTRRPLPLGEYAIFAPSTDGTQIVFTRDGGQHILRYELATDSVHRIESLPGNVSAIRECKDGFLLVATGPGDRCGVVYFLDGRSWKTKPLFSQEK